MLHENKVQGGLAYMAVMSSSSARPSPVRYGMVWYIHLEDLDRIPGLPSHSGHVKAMPLKSRVWLA
jgi:hypothetical protein